jgi:O-antigen/teichoic acid export membrane protein
MEDEGPRSHPLRQSLIWMFSSQGLLSGMQLGVVMVLGRLLGPVEFGIVTIFLVLAQLFGHLTTLGFGPALVQSQHIQPRHVSTALSVAMAGGLISGSALYLLRKPLLALFQMPEAAGLPLWFFPLCFVSGLHLVLRSLMQKGARFRWLSIVESSSFLVAYALPAILLASFGWGATSVIVAFTLNQTVNAAAFWLVLRPAWHPGMQTESIRDLSRTGLGFGLSEFLSILSQSLDKLLVGALLGTAAVGLYGRAYALMLAGMQILTAPLDAVMFPAFSEAQDARTRLRELLGKTQVLLVLLCLPPALLMLSCPAGIIRIMLGPDWSAADSLLRVFGFLLLIRVQGRAADSILRARGLVYRRLLVTIVFSLLMVMFVTIGARFGLLGVALGVTLSFVAHWLLVVRMVLREIGLTWRGYLAALIRPILWGAVTTTPLLLLEHFGLAASTGPVWSLIIAGLWVAAAFGISLWWRPALVFGAQAPVARLLLADLLQGVRWLNPSARP